MDFSDLLIKEFNRSANKTLSRICRISVVLLIVVMILNYTGVFVIGQVIYPVLIASGVILLTPTIFYDIMGKEREVFKYIVLTMLVFMSGLLYAILSYHVIVMLVFPIVVSCIYSDKKSVIFTSLLGVPVLIVSHLLALQFKVVPDEPLVRTYSVVVYGIIPRLLEYSCFVSIAASITSRFSKLKNQLINKNNEIFFNQEMLITSMTELLEVQSRETGQHLTRVAKYTEVICKGLGMGKEEVWKVSTASMMHDIGKILIPNEILEKPGKLTEAEYSLVKNHTRYGRQMLEKSEGEVMKIAAVIADQHHEYYNGKGYNGMLGENIDLYARIVSIADVFDALVSKRCYKEAWSLEDAKNEILKQSGQQFDPKLVFLFNENFDKFAEICNSYKD